MKHVWSEKHSPSVTVVHVKLGIRKMHVLCEKFENVEIT